MEIWTRKGVKVVCPEKEYLADVIREIRLLKQSEELYNDPFFERAAMEMILPIKLVWKDKRSRAYENFMMPYKFRFNMNGKHHKGDVYLVSSALDALLLEKDVESWVQLEEFTPDSLHQAINDILIQEVLSL